MIHRTVCKADPVGEEGSPSAILDVSGSIRTTRPIFADFDDDGTGERAHNLAFFDAEAAKIMEVILRLPGGTVDALLIALLQHRRNELVVR